jgi:DNA repair protein RecO (recombination protein O)
VLKGHNFKDCPYAAVILKFFKGTLFVLYKTQGIIIKRNNLGDFDRLLTVYTGHFGKILLKGKSIRKNQSKLKGHLELFSYVDLLIAPARNALRSDTGGPVRRLDVITGAETIESFHRLRKNLPSLSATYYLSELTDKMVIGSERDENVWPTLLSSFRELNRPSQNIKAVVSNFENKLLEFLGYGHQKNPLNFIESFLRESLNSKHFLQEAFYLLE